LGDPKDELELTIWQCGVSSLAVLLEIVMNMDACGQAFLLTADWCKISPFAG
jgi:hypothetical protein